MRAPVFDLSLLRTLVTIADSGTVTAAARQLAYTQSTVSMQLQRLEDQLQLTLHERDGRHIRFTHDGQRLLSCARQLLAMNDQVMRAFADAPLTGRLTLGIPEDYAMLLSSVFAWFHQQYPAVNLELVCHSSAHLIKEVQRGALDLALVTRQRHSPGGEFIRREPLLWATGLNARPPLDKPLPLALYSPGADVFREVAEHALQTAGRDWRVTCTSRSMSGLAPVVTAGLAIVVITHSMLTPSLKVLDESSGLPVLPAIELALHWSPPPPSEQAILMGDLLREHLSSG